MLPLMGWILDRRVRRMPAILQAGRLRRYIPVFVASGPVPDVRLFLPVSVASGPVSDVRLFLA